MNSQTQTLSYKYDANPTKENIQRIEKHLKIHKNIYNKALETLNNSDDWIPKYEMYNKLPEWKKTSNSEFQNVHSKSAQETVGRIYRAIKGLSTKKQKGQKVGKLRYKNSINSIEYNQSGFKINEKDGYIHLSKIGNIHVNFHREIPENTKIKGIIIKKYSNNDWKIILNLKIPLRNKKPITEDSDIIGIDLNVSNFLTDSKGRKIQDLKEILYDKSKRVRKEQKRLSRKQKNSNNWKKQKQRLAKAHKKLRNARRDFLHKLSRAYVENHDVIIIEDIDSKNLSESKSSKLNRHIANHAWNEFVSMLVYKASQAGKQIIEIDPKNTTKNCSNPDCNNKVDKKLSDRTHKCSECGLEIDRDLNASVNIVNKGISLVRQGLSEVKPSDIMTSGDTISLSRVVEQGSSIL